MLQRRHLYKQPLEYLVKCRIESGKYREKWLPQAVLVTMEHGQALIREFKKTKVGQMGVDAYIGKRRSLVRKSLPVGAEPQTKEESNGDANRPSQNHIQPTTEGTVLSDGKTKSASKPNWDTARGKNDGHNAEPNHSLIASDFDAGCAVSTKQPAKSKVTSSKLKDRHLRNSSPFSRIGFGSHKTKSAKNSSLRRSAPPFSGERPKKKAKTPEKNNCVGSVVQLISLATLSKTGTNMDDDVVSVSSESSGEVLYSLACQAREEIKNGDSVSDGSTNTKRKRVDASNSQKKLRVALARAVESPESDSEVNFKLSTSGKTHSKSSSKTGEIQMRLFGLHVESGAFMRVYVCLGA